MVQPSYRVRLPQPLEDASSTFHSLPKKRLKKAAINRDRLINLISHTNTAYAKPDNQLTQYLSSQKPQGYIASAHAPIKARTDF